MRNNLGFESAWISPDGAHLFAATENALAQDGPAATLTTSSPARLLRYDSTGHLDRDFVYVVEPVQEAPDTARGTNVRGWPALPADPDAIQAVHKTLLFDFDVLGLTLDNLEGLAFGPVLPGDRRSVVVVSDNNFSPDAFTQFLGFTI